MSIVDVDRDFFSGDLVYNSVNSANTKRIFWFNTYSAVSGRLPPRDSIDFNSHAQLIWDIPFTYLTNDVHDAGLTAYLEYCFCSYFSRVSPSEYERYYKRAFQAHNVQSVDQPLSYNEYIRFLFVRCLQQFFETLVSSSNRVLLDGPGSAVVSLDENEDSLTVDLFQFSTRVLDFRPSGGVVSVVFSPIQTGYDPVLRAWSRNFFDFFQSRSDHFSVKSDRLRAGVAPCDVDVDGDIVV